MAALLDTARYAAANAQVRALSTSMVDPHLWRRILDAPDLETIQSLLQQAGMDHGLATQGDEPAAVRIERRLMARLVTLSRLPARLIAGKPRDLLLWYWRRFEIDNLKTALRAVHYQEPWSAVAPVMLDLDAHSDVHWRQLAQAGTIQALIDRLPPGSDRQALAQAMPRYRRERSLFVLEASLDLAYSRRLRDLIRALQGRDRREADAYLGFPLDARNLLWAYRYRIYAHLSPEEILNYTLHRGLRINAEAIRAIALGAPLAEMERLLWADQMAGDASDHAAPADEPARESLARIELECRRHLVRRARRTWAGYPLHLGTLLAYLVLLEAETQDLTAICEGRSFGWPLQRIQPFLVGNRG